MKKLFAIIVLFILAMPGFADYSNGYYNSDGYAVYGDGYYWRGNDAFTRQAYQNPGYYRGCYYYPGATYYQYTYSHRYTPPAQVTYQDAGWRSKLLDLAKARDRIEGDIRKNQFEQQYFMDAVKALGFEGNFRIQNYGASPLYSQPRNYGTGGYGYGNLQLSSAGVNGSTVYGYNYNAIKDFWGDTSPAQLYQQAFRLAENMQNIAGEATTQHGTLVGQEGEWRAKVATILAKEQAVRSLMETIDGKGGKIVERSFSFGTKNQVGPPAPSQPQPQVQPLPQNNINEVSNIWQKSAEEKCANCHYGKRKEGGFDVSLFPSMDAAQQERVLQRIFTKDEGKRMPRKDDGGVAPELTEAEKQAWIGMSKTMPPAK